MVRFAAATRRTISQATFNEAVRDFIEDLELSLKDAIAEARDQFTANGVDLVGIRDPDGASMSPETGGAANLLEELNGAIADRNEDRIRQSLEGFDKDAAKELAEEGLIGAVTFVCREYSEKESMIMSALSLLVKTIQPGMQSLIPEPSIIALIMCLIKHCDNLTIQLNGKRFPNFSMNSAILMDFFQGEIYSCFGQLMSRISSILYRTENVNMGN